MKCDVDIRKDLYANTVMSGGTTMYPTSSQSNRQSHKGQALMLRFTNLRIQSAWKQWRCRVQRLTLSASVMSSEQMQHSSRSTPASRCWICNMRSINLMITSRKKIWPDFLVLQPRIANPVEINAPTTPSTCDVAAAAAPRSATFDATCVAVPVAPPATAPAMSPPSITCPTEPAELLWVVARSPVVLSLRIHLLPEAPSACCASTHCFINSATTKEFHASTES